MKVMKVLPHEKLGITFDTLLAFLGIHAALKNGVMRARGITEVAKVKGDHLFDMSCIKNNYSSCGSIGCIGGYTYPLAKESLRTYDARKGWMTKDRDTFMSDPVLKPLFYPMLEDKRYKIDDWGAIPTTATIKTMEHFFATGKVAWKKFVPKHMVVKRHRD